MELLLLSNSAQPGRPPLEHALDEIAALVGPELLFVPYALADHEAYTASIGAALAGAGVTVRGVHAADDPVAAVADAPAVFVGGGNSFRLLSALQRLGLVDAIREAVRGGRPYLGASAGTNMACPTLRTTNDMPIVQPAGFDTLGLIPFQINPHYLDPDPSSTHMGETREKRITEFLECNDVPVLGLREGSWLRVSGDAATLGGRRPARLFQRGADPVEYSTGSDLSFLLRATARFDAAAG